MSIFTKTGPWITASLCAASSIFGQNCEPQKCQPVQCKPKCCDPVPEVTLMPGYNQCSRIDVRCGWDVFTTGSFTYWQPVQDNMELGVVYDTADSPNRFGNVVNADFDYKPGFKVALGMDFDRDCWETMLEYTWFRSQHSTSTTLSTSGTDALLPLWVSPVASFFYAGKEKWRLNMDFLDWQLARSYYVGTKLTFRPFFAARAAWIRQNVDVEYTNSVSTGSSTFVDKRSHSWAIGPRAGLNASWMIGDGFRFYGNGAGDILFTQYTKLSTKEQSVSAAGVAGGIFRVTQKKLNTLRTHLDLELGLGWGSYLDCNKWHIDFSAGYGFQVFFDQNMFRHFTDDIGVTTSNTPNGNLYVHGLTATARLDF